MWTGPCGNCIFLHGGQCGILRHGGGDSQCGNCILRGGEDHLLVVCRLNRDTSATHKGDTFFLIWTSSNNSCQFTLQRISRTIGLGEMHFRNTFCHRGTSAITLQSSNNSWQFTLCFYSKIIYRLKSGAGFYPWFTISTWPTNRTKIYTYNDYICRGKVHSTSYTSIQYTYSILLFNFFQFSTLTHTDWFRLFESLQSKQCSVVWWCVVQIAECWFSQMHRQTHDHTCPTIWHKSRVN